MPTQWKSYAAVLVRCLPFFALWVLVAKTSAAISFREAFVSSSISVGAAACLGIGVWHLCDRMPWPLRAKISFYAIQGILSVIFTVSWNLLICALESIRGCTNVFPLYWTSRALGWQLLIGIFIYGVFAGVSYSVQTRNRLHEKELLAIRAEALAGAARMDAIRSRLNPHFLFNALHTLSALAKFKPNVVEQAFERLGDMLRYALKDDKRHVVEFSEEYDFTRQYLWFEQLRYEDRLRVEYQIDPESFNCDIPPFSMQTLAENAVQHAISVRPEGGCIWITSTCRDGGLVVTVRDDGPGEGFAEGKSHQFGLSSLRERLSNLFGSAATLTTTSGPDGFEASFEIPEHGEHEGPSVGSERTHE